ncbi:MULTISPECIES: transposase [Acinetobacter]|jgi:transposase-like protein|uniref:Transposase n=2 Tax=Acinetobacter johnsonii TaxID=40214 RepID=A0AA42LEB6_ACIJO|nr:MULTISPECIES: transposase [Acinetobacter]MDH0656802.1 transposase [Acinetobacter johnsonii]MDH1069948.1 transposase [Acinetobacter johnsonii]MDO7410170.1 transposase [Acinetobacter baumannii]
MTTITHASTISASAPRKRRTYSTEFKNSIVQACRVPNTSIASVALQHGLNANLVCKWIRLLDGEQALDNSAPPKPTFIALPYPAAFNPSTIAMLPVHITLPDSNIEIGLKWQGSEMSALAELLKALAT